MKTIQNLLHHLKDLHPLHQLLHLLTDQVHSNTVLRPLRLRLYQRQTLLLSVDQILINLDLLPLPSPAHLQLPPLHPSLLLHPITTPCIDRTLSHFPRVNPQHKLFQFPLLLSPLQPLSISPCPLWAALLPLITTMQDHFDLELRAEGKGRVIRPLVQVKRLRFH